MNHSTALISSLAECLEILSRLIGSSFRTAKLIESASETFIEMFQEKERTRNLPLYWTNLLVNMEVIAKAIEVLEADLWNSQTTQKLRIPPRVFRAISIFAFGAISAIKSPDLRRSFCYRLEKAFEDYFADYKEPLCELGRLSQAIEIFDTKELLAKYMEKQKFSMSNYDTLRSGNLKIQLLILHLKSKNFSKRLSTVGIFNSYYNQKFEEPIKIYIVSKFIEQQALLILFRPENEEILKLLDPFLKFMSPGISLETLLELLATFKESTHSQSEIFHTSLIYLTSKIDMKVYYEIISFGNTNPKRISAEFLKLLADNLRQGEQASGITGLVSNAIQKGSGPLQAVRKESIELFFKE